MESCFETRTIVGQSVHECAKFLDGVFPGWESKVDPDTIDLSSNTGCVVGQLYGHAYSSIHWPTIATTYTAAIEGHRGTERFWRSEIETRLPAPDVFPKKWVKMRPRVVR